MESQNSNRERLDATGPREVVFCHQCEHDWYRDESGLICPNCDGEITEIVSPSSDPRPGASPPSPEDNSEIRDFDHHYPWANADIPDPDEEDIEHHIPHLRDPSSQWNYARRGHPRREEAQNADDHSNVIQGFQSMINTLIGPNVQTGQTGRSGPDALFSNQDGVTRNTYISNGPNGSAQVTRITYRSPGLRPRDAGAPQAQAQRVEDISLVLGNLFNAMGPLANMQHNHNHDHEGGGARGSPLPLGGLFSQLFNPANAAAGDAVFTQEALDRVISDLMENHQTSNAPGPAPPEAIAQLPKKKLTTEMLGGDAKGECSVCMDDVHAGDEVVELPCCHWFHETCVSAWLGEHNTCPICRKGLESESPSQASPNASRHPSFSNTDPSRAPSNFETQNSARLAAVRERSEARLNSILERSGRYDDSPYRDNMRGSPRAAARSPSPTPAMPGSFSPSQNSFSGERSGSFRRRNSTLSESQSSSRSRRSGSEGGGGVTGWLRDRFSGRRE